MTLTLGGFDPRATYSAAAETYERASHRYWRFLSTRTVEWLDLHPGHQVLDVACGTGPATVEAARRVCPGGRVVAVDYADGMLEVAHRNVAASGVGCVELVKGDMLSLPYGPEFDAVISVLGVFFVPDMAAAVRAWSGHVRPGGSLSVSVFGTEVWEPVLGRFIETARRTAPDIEYVVPWRRMDDPEVVAQMFADAGVAGVRIRQVVDDLPFSPDDWPTIVMGSGLRRIANDLGPTRCAAVLADVDQWSRAMGISTVRLVSTYATAVKPA